MKIIDTRTSATINLNNLKLPENILVFSHLRWDFVYQRPQHLLTRFARHYNIVFIEEPIFDASDKPHYSFSERDANVIIMVPHIKPGLTADETRDSLKGLFNQYMEHKDLSNYAFWYYTPMALDFSRKYLPDMVIYDCMDELSAFKFAPERLKALEQELMNISDVVFTGGQSLYEAKKNQHFNIHPFPSSIDKKHFLKARAAKQAQPHKKPTLGFYGVIDERFDIELIRQMAVKRPEWQIELIGPVVKIDERTLPRNKNIHYLGPKNYQELPACMAGWDIALIPFLLNESTRFISPTKTPEYLAAGLPVISTAIRDVVSPYALNKLVYIGHNAADFIAAAGTILALNARETKAWLARVDGFLALNSWDKTCADMQLLIKNTLTSKSQTSVAQ